MILNLNKQIFNLFNKNLNLFHYRTLKTTPCTCEAGCVWMGRFLPTTEGQQPDGTGPGAGTASPSAKPEEVVQRRTVDTVTRKQWDRRPVIGITAETRTMMAGLMTIGTGNNNNNISNNNYNNRIIMIVVPPLHHHLLVTVILPLVIPIDNNNSNNNPSTVECGGVPCVRPRVRWTLRGPERCSVPVGTSARDTLRNFSTVIWKA